MIILSDIGILGGWLFVASVAGFVLLFGLALAADRQDGDRRTPTQPSVIIGAACPWCTTRDCLDRTLCTCAMPCGSWLCMACPCCTGDSDDCTCTADCGVPRCQMADPEVPRA